MWFHLTVLFNLIRNRPAAALRMTVVAFIAALWCVGGFVWTLATLRDLDRQASEVRVEVVMKTSAAESVAKSIVRDLRRMPSMRQATIVYPTQMWKEFSSELSVNDDLQDVVVLPIVIRFHPTVEHVNSKWLNMVGSSISSMYSQSVQQVIWPADFVQMIDARRTDIMLFGGAAGVMSLIVFVIAMQHAFRSELQLAARDLKVLSSLGAPTLWASTPHFMLGLLCGTVGFLFAIGGFLALRPSLLDSAAWLGAVSVTEILALTLVLCGIGIVFTFLQAASTARKSYKTRGTY